MTERNRQLLLRERPTEEVTAEHFEMVVADVPTPGDGEVLLRDDLAVVRPGAARLAQ